MNVGLAENRAAMCGFLLSPTLISCLCERLIAWVDMDETIDAIANKQTRLYDEATDRLLARHNLTVGNLETAGYRLILEKEKNEEFIRLLKVTDRERVPKLVITSSVV